MFHKEKLNDVSCARKMLYVCKMQSQRNEFKNELKLSDHLYRIEQDIINMKLNMTLMEEAMHKTTTKEAIITPD